LEVETSNNKLGRIYSLKSKITIDALFESGKRISSFPYVLFYKEVEYQENVPFKLVFSAPKKTFRFAYQRNKMKRLMRESVRLNKHPLEAILRKKNKQLAFFLIYSTKEQLDFDILQKKTVKLFDKLIQQLDD